VRIIEELLEWKSSGSGQENRINGRGIRCADHATLSIRKTPKLAQTSPTSGGRSIGIVRSRTKDRGFKFFFKLAVVMKRAKDEGGICAEFPTNLSDDTALYAGRYPSILVLKAEIRL
jgi:hypothetical protein